MREIVIRVDFDTLNILIEDVPRGWTVRVDPANGVSVTILAGGQHGKKIEESPAEFVTENQRYATIYTVGDSPPVQA